MPDCRPGDVVRVPFPYTDRPVRQHRPALVIASPDTGNARLLWVLMITSAANRGWRGDVEIMAGDTSGLPAPSLVRTAKIATIDDAAADPIGRIDDASMARIRTIVRSHFDS